MLSRSPTMSGHERPSFARAQGQTSVARSHSQNDACRVLALAHRLGSAQGSGRLRASLSLLPSRAITASVPLRGMGCCMDRRGILCGWWYCLLAFAAVRGFSRESFKQCTWFFLQHRRMYLAQDVAIEGCAVRGRGI